MHSYARLGSVVCATILTTMFTAPPAFAQPPETAPPEAAPPDATPPAAAPPEAAPPATTPPEATAAGATPPTSKEAEPTHTPLTSAAKPPETGATTAGGPPETVTVRRNPTMMYVGIGLLATGGATMIAGGIAMGVLGQQEGEMSGLGALVVGLPTMGAGLLLLALPGAVLTGLGARKDEVAPDDPRAVDQQAATRNNPVPTLSIGPTSAYATWVF
jgi:hypothetical protein